MTESFIAPARASDLVVMNIPKKSLAANVIAVMLMTT